MLISLIIFTVLFFFTTLIFFFLYHQKSKKVNSLYEEMRPLTDGNIRLELLQGQIATLNTEKKEKETQIITLIDKNAGLQKELELQSKTLLDREKLFKDMEEKFKLISNESLENNSRKTNMGIKEILDTQFKEKIELYGKKMEEFNKSVLEQSTALKTEIKNNTEKALEIGKQAENLTNALRGDKKALGNWGEVQLTLVLEHSGLKKDEDYKTQFTIASTNEDDKKMRPDVIINLPENKQIIIDAKASLVNYENYYHSESGEEQKVYLEKMIVDIKNRVNELSDKNYHKANELNSTDFVIMFMPIEAAYITAVNFDKNLVEFGWKKNVIIANSSTLFSILKGIAHIRQLETQNKYALEIAKDAGSMYDKFVGFLDNFQKIGNQLRISQKTYDVALGQLKEGNGSVSKKMEELREKGIKTSKQIPAPFLPLNNEELFIEGEILDEKDPTMF